MSVGEARTSSVPFSYGSIGGYIVEFLGGVESCDIVRRDKRADDRAIDKVGRGRQLGASRCLK